MAQSTANWRNTHTHMDRMHSLTHLHRCGYNHVRSAISAITEFVIKFYLWVHGSSAATASCREFLTFMADDSVWSNSCMVISRWAWRESEFLCRSAFRKPLFVDQLTAHMEVIVMKSFLTVLWIQAIFHFYINYLPTYSKHFCTS